MQHCDWSSDVCSSDLRGSGGAKHVLTDEEIAGAAAIIVAADTKVPMDRFDGKKVIECKVADGIKIGRASCRERV